MIDLNMKPKRKSEFDDPQPEEIAVMITAMIIWGAILILLARAI